MQIKGFYKVRHIMKKSKLKRLLDKDAILTMFF